jgi:sterol desaturase/sphingolipid hydroxylase (fatty acid hydroxylase superfamily)
MRTRGLRVVLVMMTLGHLGVGAWAQFAPRSFYDSFPGGGRHWVRVDGPFNEHLVRDVGGLNLALAVIAAFAAVDLGLILVRALSIGSIAYWLPHLVYHANHLTPFGTADKLANVGSLAFGLLLPIVALALTLDARPEDAHEP